MNRAGTAIAGSILALSAAALGAPNAVATHPAENGARPSTVVPHDPQPPRIVEVPVDDARSEAVQAGSFALGGAGVAIGAVWIHRRRRAANG